MALQILTWNISWGYGIGSEGNDAYQPRAAIAFEQSLEALADQIRATGADLVLLQEVDFASSRSHHQNQLKALSHRTGLLYQAALTSWDCAYVPYPGLNPFRHFGKIRSGGGILSRYPIQTLKNELLPKPAENTSAYNFFYLSRFIQVVETCGIRICNLHLEAFSRTNRALHLERFSEILREMKVDLAGGDFNGEVELSEAISKDYQVLRPPGPTFPSLAPVEYLDHFVVKKGRFKRTQISIPESPASSRAASDHLPVKIEVET